MIEHKFKEYKMKLNQVILSAVIVSLSGLVSLGISFSSPSVLEQTMPTPVVWTDGKSVCYLSFSGGISCLPLSSPFTPTPTPTPKPTQTPTPTSTPTRTSTATPLPPTPTVVPPTPTRLPPTPIRPVLKNPGFEDGLEHWTPFTIYSQTNLEFNVEALSKWASQWVVRSGDKSLRIKGMYQCWDAGYYQVVPMTPGTRFRFSVYAMTWGRNSSDINLPTDPNLMSFVYAGIDPYGFTQASNTRVQWSSAPGTDSILDFPGVGEYAKPIVVEGIAVADRVTLFIRANLGGVPQCIWPYQSMLAFFDEASLTVVP